MISAMKKFILARSNAKGNGGGIPNPPINWIDPTSNTRCLANGVGVKLASLSNWVPRAEDIWRPLELVGDPRDVKVVIVGQDPYPGEGVADGLAFSCRATKRPASLRVILKEVASSKFQVDPNNNSLENWANQGVLLINLTMTCALGEPNSHRHIGWEPIVSHIIKEVVRKSNGTVFMFWGRAAQTALSSLCSTSKKHLILKAPHPSPLNRCGGFAGCGHFVRANKFLRSIGKTEVDWSIPAKDEAPMHANGHMGSEEN